MSQSTARVAALALLVGGCGPPANWADGTWEIQRLEPAQPLIREAALLGFFIVLGARLEVEGERVALILPESPPIPLVREPLGDARFRLRAPAADGDLFTDTVAERQDARTWVMTGGSWHRTVWRRVPDGQPWRLDCLTIDGALIERRGCEEGESPAAVRQRGAGPGMVLPFGGR